MIARQVVGLLSAPAAVRRSADKAMKGGRTQVMWKRSYRRSEGRAEHERGVRCAGVQERVGAHGLARGRHSM